MLDWTIKKFNTTSKLMMGKIIGKNEPSIETYEDMVVMNYALPKPMELEDIMDILEDNADMEIFYIAEKQIGDSVAQHMCAVCIPSGIYMYKVFAQCDKGSLVTELTISLFTSLDQMNNSLLSDQNVHEELAFQFEYIMDDGKYAALFCL